MNKLSGFKYLTFGLREEWLEDFIKEREAFFVKNTLGPKQLEAFIQYLRDMEIIDKKNRTTILFDFISKIYEVSGISDTFLWSILWVNLCFNAPLFRWWTNISPGIYSRETIIDMMVESYGKKNRSIINGYDSLVGTLERTPIGDRLRQVRVIRNRRGRTVIKEGAIEISPFSILYSLYKVGERDKQYSIILSRGDPLFPAKIFAIEESIVESKLNSLWLPEIFSMHKEEGVIFVNLKEDKSSLDILSMYMRRNFDR